MKKIDKFKNLKENLNGPVQTIFVPFNNKLNVDYFALKKHINIVLMFLQ